MLCLWVLLFSPEGKSQEANGAAMSYSRADVEQLYRLCKNVREDTLNRICGSYLNDHNLRKNPEAFQRFCEAFEKYCRQQNNPTLERRMAIIALHGRLRFDSAHAGRASEAFEEMHEQYRNQKDYAAALECLFEEGQFLHRVRENIKAMQVLFYAEKFAEEYKLQQKISYHGILHKIGYILWQLDKPARSISYFKKALLTGNGIQIDSLIALNGIGINYQKQDSLQQSLQYFTQASRVALNGRNEIFNTVVLGSAAATWEKLGELDTAYYYSNLYKNLAFRDGLWENVPDAFHKMVQIELQRNNIAHARVLLDSFAQYMGRVNAEDYLAYKMQKEANYSYYLKVKDFEKALYAYREYVHYDSLFQDYGNKNRISEIELNAAVRLYEQEMAAKEKARKWQAFISNAITVVVIAAFCLLLIYAWKRSRKIEREKKAVETLNQSQASEIEKLKEELLLQLATIREYNHQFQANTKKEEGQTSEPASPADTPTEESKPAGEAAKPNTDRLLSDFNLTQKEQWKGFRESFMKTYPDFETKIMAKAGAVSGAELRLMMLHKLGLSNKEIAETLLISADGVKKAKYRLYKKLNVSSSEELSEFLE